MTPAVWPAVDHAAQRIIRPGWTSGPAGRGPRCANLPRADRASAKTHLAKTITVISAAVPTALTELITLGRTLKRRAADVPALFDRAGTSNGPAEAINGRLRLRNSAPGFRNLARSLLEAGGSDHIR